MAKRSRSNAEGDRLGSGLVVFETLSQDSKGKDLRFCHGVVRRVAVRKNAGQLRHFRKPPAVVLALALDFKVHGNAHFTPLLSRCLTTELSGRPRPPCRGQTRPTMPHGPLERVVRQLFHDSTRRIARRPTSYSQLPA